MRILIVSRETIHLYFFHNKILIYNIHLNVSRETFIIDKKQILKFTLLTYNFNTKNFIVKKSL